MKATGIRNTRTCERRSRGLLDACTRWIHNFRMWWRRRQQTPENFALYQQLREATGAAPILALQESPPVIAIEPAPAMGCPFYGYAAKPSLQLLLDTHGNQCALIWENHAPCSMEIAGHAPDITTCPRLQLPGFLERAAVTARFNEVHGWSEIR
jgi:hypothetical protein